MARKKGGNFESTLPINDLSKSPVGERGKGKNLMTISPEVPAKGPIDKTPNPTNPFGEGNRARIGIKKT